MKKICIIDYGLGNIKSLHNALNYLGYKPEFYTETNSKVFDIIFIPGIGSFSKASKLLKNSKFEHFINDSINKSLIFGICLGMQIFFSKGMENGNNLGLDLIEGNVDSLEDLNNNKKMILPIVGFKEVYFDKKIKILEKFERKKFYFIHSYAAKPNIDDDTIALTKIDDFEYCVSVKKNRIFGTQFHPEKSGNIGLEFIKTVINNF
jgi:imidazole glycerol-phosphate synthase subunit HisH